ncbi:uncharacterized protein LOC107401814 isoform X6 [Peromyscus maniculatus bairdii]|uniref:uncharacterized protein LOC107401814 isoform X6 n=1 Tax=Peromyscus maniculatus bairdii TaxID=230844 RepID=UPI001C2E79D9|nr:uncharacterized protein LOC107401814 isoform X5 [Peromyscus maniculatus bairdii]
MVANEMRGSSRGHSPPPCSPLPTSRSKDPRISGTRGTEERGQAGKAARQWSIRKCAPVGFPRGWSAGPPRTHLPQYCRSHDPRLGR